MNVFHYFFSVRSYTVLRSGELLIHETQEKDAMWSYRCQTRHRLTGEMVISVSFGKIVVTGKYIVSNTDILLTNICLNKKVISFVILNRLLTQMFMHFLFINIFFRMSTHKF